MKNCGYVVTVNVGIARYRSGVMSTTAVRWAGLNVAAVHGTLVNFPSGAATIRYSTSPPALNTMSSTVPTAVLFWIDTRVPHLRLRVLVGATGSAKTLLLQALAAQGEQVLDLEALAVHKGSVLGNVPGRTQPSQTAFETGLVHTLQLLDPQRTIWVEGESRKIGKVALPQALVDRLRAAPCVEIEATAEARLAYLLRDYAYLGDDRTALAERLGWLKGLHSNETLARWQAWARQGELPALFRELMQAHYDPLYARSQASHFALWPQRQKLWTDDLSEAAVGALATAARALPSAG